MSSTAPAQASACSRCEGLPTLPAGPGRLYLWLPLGHTLGKVAFYLSNTETAHTVVAAQAQVTLDVVESDLAEAFGALASLLSPEEARDTRALFMANFGEPGLADFARVSSFAELCSRSESGWLVALLAEERLTSHFQPIVEANDTSRIFAHEALLRGLDTGGGLVSPAALFGTGRDAGMLFQLDLAGRRTAIREAHRHGLTGQLFINFSPSAIYDPVYCLRSTLALIDELGISRRRIVFEVVESDHVESVDHLIKILTYYREVGFGIALDDLGAGFSSLNLLHQLQPDYVKLDMGLVRNVDQEPYKAAVTSKLIEMARSLGVRTIAEGIETPGELAWLRAHGTDLVQGFLIARPSSPPHAATPALPHALTVN